MPMPSIESDSSFDSDSSCVMTVRYESEQFGRFGPGVVATAELGADHGPSPTFLGRPAMP